MPVLKGSVGFRRFRVEPVGEPPKDFRRWVIRALKRRAFEPIDPAGELDRALGWVEVEDPERVELAPDRVLIGEYVLASLRIDRLRVPPAAVRAELAKWEARFREQHPHPPARAQRRQQKELIERKLRGRVFPSTKSYDFSWSPQAQRVELWATAPKIVEEMSFLFEETFEVRLHALTPGVLAELAGAANLGPTPELIGAALVAELGSPRAQAE